VSNQVADPIAAFEAERARNIEANASDADWLRISREWLMHAFRTRYMYNFTSLGRPIIQTPADIVGMQELIWSVKPDLIIETGIAHGGSLILSASVLALLDYADAATQGRTLDPAKPARKVLGIDIDIRAHNRAAIESHPLAGRIEMIQGSSIAPEIVAEAKRRAAGKSRVLVALDSNHTHEHVLAELNAYAPLVSVGSYCVVFDTVIEDLPPGSFPDRPWDKGDNAKTAVREYVRQNPAFEIDKSIDNKLLTSLAPDGYLKRVR
jgi:cephalosporin hydroxylase